MTDDPWLIDAQRSYDTVAQNYAEFTRGALDLLPRERAFLDAFAELVTAGHPGRVLDAGCGPGWVSAYLARQGVNVTGVDLSPGLIEIARRNHPTIPFSVGSLTDLPVAADSLAGIVCWYVLHHVPDDALERVFDQFARSLDVGGVLLIGGHAGSGTHVKADGYGGLPMRVLIAKRPVELFVQLLRDRGFLIDIQATLYPDGPAPSLVILAHLE